MRDEGRKVLPDMDHDSFKIGPHQLLLSLITKKHELCGTELMSVYTITFSSGRIYNFRTGEILQYAKPTNNVPPTIFPSVTGSILCSQPTRLMASG
jgi:hypothetical protein